MTPKEAIEWLEAIEEKYIHGGDDYFDEKRRIAINNAINALEKQIPKKILDKTLEFDGYYGLCPCCNKVVGESKDFGRCWHCGQALDWSDTK